VDRRLYSDLRWTLVDSASLHAARRWSETFATPPPHRTGLQ